MGRGPCTLQNAQVGLFDARVQIPRSRPGSQPRRASLPPGARSRRVAGTPPAADHDQFTPDRITPVDGSEAHRRFIGTWDVVDDAVGCTFVDDNDTSGSGTL